MLFQQKFLLQLSQPGTALHGAMDLLQVLNPLFMQQTTPLMKISMPVLLKISAAVVINSGFTMTITNELTILGGFLTFENDASLVQINETAINSGNITYKRESASVRPSDYSYWSSPVADQTFSCIPNFSCQ
jgi:hypothetical protein